MKYKGALFCFTPPRQPACAGDAFCTFLCGCVCPGEMHPLEPFVSPRLVYPLYSPPCILLSSCRPRFFFNTIHTKCFSGWFLIILNAFCSQPLLNHPEPANYSKPPYRGWMDGGGVYVSGVCVCFFFVLIFLWLPLILTRSTHSRRPYPVPT